VLGTGRLRPAAHRRLPRRLERRQDLSWTDVALLARATLLNLVTFAPRWMAGSSWGRRFRMRCHSGLDGISYIAWREEVVGMALSFAMLRA
jgi:hypothetical protein